MRQAERIEPASNEEALIRMLEEPGDENVLLETVMPEQPDFDSRYVLPPWQDHTCQLCKINRYPFDSEERVFYETDDYFLVDAAGAPENGLKGHNVRNMGVLKDHGEIPVIGDSEKEMMERLIDVTAGHVQDGRMLVFGSMQTFQEHFHIMASDLYGDDPDKIDDLAGINNYMMFEVENGEPRYLDQKNGDTLGHYIEEMAQSYIG